MHVPVGQEHGDLGTVFEYSRFELFVERSGFRQISNSIKIFKCKTVGLLVAKKQTRYFGESNVCSVHESLDSCRRRKPLALVGGWLALAQLDVQLPAGYAAGYRE